MDHRINKIINTTKWEHITNFPKYAIRKKLNQIINVSHL